MGITQGGGGGFLEGEFANFFWKNFLPPPPK